MQTLRRYWQTHHGTASPLLCLYDHIRAHGQPDAATISELAREIGFPEATVRSVIDYYENLYRPRDTVQVCQGTSCLLAGAAKLQANLSARQPCEGVYCLGYCDRSPAVLRPNGEVLWGEAAQALASPADSRTGGARSGEFASPPARPEPTIRCLAPRPIVTRRIGRGDFSALAAARADGAYAMLRAALARPPHDILAAVTRSGHRGRGGAGFPTALKWQVCTESPADKRYVVANGDEGDPGSFIDRVLMERDPHAVIEGMVICAYTVGAQEGIVFIRGEYPAAIARMRAAIDEARAAGVLGANVLDSGFGFELSVFPGMGSYVCGEETALLSAIEGFRGEVRIRPPYPTEAGLYGQPTVVNNVETLVSIPSILEDPEGYAARGTAKSSGTKAMCLNHGFARPGIVEIEFGLSLRELIAEAGGGADGQQLEAILLGGPMGSVVVPAEWDVPICYSAMANRNIVLGHGGLVAVPAGTDYRALLEHWLQFMMDESCGKCVPCRLGSERAAQLLRDGSAPTTRAQFLRLFEVMEDGSFCGFGQLMPAPMRRLVEVFGERIFR